MQRLNIFAGIKLGIISIAGLGGIFFLQYQGGNTASHLIPTENLIGFVEIQKNTNKYQELIHEVLKEKITNEDEVNFIRSLANSPVNMALFVNGVIFTKSAENRLPAPKNWEEHVVDNAVVYSNIPYQTPQTSLAESNRYIQTRKNVRTGDDVIFYLDIENFVKNQNFYYGWKKFLPNFINTVGGSIKKTNEKLNIQTVLHINKNLLPKKDIRQSKLNTIGLLNMTSGNEPVVIMGENVTGIIDRIKSGIEKNNLPLAIEMEEKLNELLNTLMIKNIDPAELFKLFSSEFVIQYNPSEKTFSIVSTAFDSPVDTILASIQNESKYNISISKRIILPDNTMGEEKVASHLSPISESSNEEWDIKSIKLSEKLQPTFAQNKKQNITIISSNPKIFEMRFTNEQKEDAIKVNNTYPVIFRIINTEEITVEPINKILNNEIHQVSGGMKFYKNALISDITIE